MSASPAQPQACSWAIAGSAATGSSVLNWGVEFGSVDESIDIGDPLLGRVESEMKNIATLVIKTGYAVNPQTLVYGTLASPAVISTIR